jgi:hypothetical protein
MMSVLSWKCIAIIKEPGRWKAEAIPHATLEKCRGLGRGGNGKESESFPKYNSFRFLVIQQFSIREREKKTSTF